MGGGTTTFRVVVALCVNVPLVPVIVKVEDPVAVPGDAVTVMVVVPDPATVAGLKAAVAPDGSPDGPKLTTPLNPLDPVIVMR
jgi:hypothetical protein